MCIGEEILSENRLLWRSRVRKVQLTALYMYLDRWIKVVKFAETMMAINNFPP